MNLKNLVVAGLKTYAYLKKKRNDRQDFKTIFAALVFTLRTIQVFYDDEE